jgi:hypothetical protein
VILNKRNRRHKLNDGRPASDADLFGKRTNARFAKRSSFKSKRRMKNMTNTVNLTDREVECLCETLYQEAKSEHVFSILDSAKFDLLLGLLEKIAPGHEAFEALRQSRAEYIEEIESGERAYCGPIGEW